MGVEAPRSAAQSPQTQPLPAATQQIAVPKTLPDETINKLIDSVLLSVGNKNTDPGSVKKAITDSLSNPSLIYTPVIPQDTNTYYVMKVYAMMLKSIGYAVAIPQESRTMSSKDLAKALPLLVNSLNSAIAQFTKGKQFNSEMQAALFSQYQDYLSKSAQIKSREDVTIVCTSPEFEGIKPTVLSVIFIDKSKNPAVAGMTYTGGNKPYVLAVAQGKDPLYEAITRIKGNEEGAIAQMGYDSFKMLTISAYADYISSLSNKIKTLGAIFSDPSKADAFRESQTLLTDIKSTLIPKTPEKGASPFVSLLTEEVKGKMNRLYDIAVQLFGSETVEKSFQKINGSNTDENRMASAKYQAAVQALSEYSLPGIQASLKELQSLIGDNDKSVSGDIDHLAAMKKDSRSLEKADVDGLSAWFESKKGSLRFSTQPGLIESAAEKLFIDTYTAGLESAQKDVFLGNLQLLKEGKLLYQPITDSFGVGLARPRKITVGSAGKEFEIKEDVIDFNVPEDDPIITNIAGTLKSSDPSFLTGQVPAVDNKTVISAFMKERGFSSAGLGQLYQSPYRPENIARQLKIQDAETAPKLGAKDIEFPEMNRRIMEENLDLQTVVKQVIDEAKLDIDAGLAMSALRDMENDGDTMVLSRRKGSETIEVRSMGGRDYGIPPEKMAKLISGLLSKVNPPTQGKTTDVFNQYGQFSNRQTYNLESISFDILKGWKGAAECQDPQKIMAVGSQVTKLFLGSIAGKDGNGGPVPLAEKEIKARIDSSLEAFINELNKDPNQKTELTEAERKQAADFSYYLSGELFKRTGVQSDMTALRPEDLSLFGRVIDSTLRVVANPEFSNAIKQLSGENVETADINPTFLSMLKQDLMTRNADKYTPRQQDIPQSGTLEVVQEDPMGSMVINHPILAVKMYLNKYSNAPDPVKKMDSGYEAYEVITANDIDALIKLSSMDKMMGTRSALTDEDLTSLINTRNQMADERSGFSSLETRFPPDSDIHKDMNRTLEILRGFRDNLTRLIEEPDGLTQRKIIQGSTGKDESRLMMIAGNAYASFKKLPSMASLAKKQNMVIDSNVLALKEQFYGRDKMTASPVIDADFIERFCADYGELLSNPVLNDIVGMHPEITNAGDPKAFLMGVAKRMKEGSQVWPSLNVNPADLKDKNTETAKVLLQSAMMLYRPGLVPYEEGITGAVRKNWDAAANFVKMVSMGPLAGDRTPSLKAFLLKYGAVDPSKEADFSLLDNKVSQNAVRACGKMFTEFLKGFSTEKDKRELVDAFEKDTMNGISLKGDTAEEKFEDLASYAKQLAGADIKQPFEFTYMGYKSGNIEMENALMVFTRSIMPQLDIEVSAGSLNPMNYGAELYTKLGGEGTIKISGLSEDKGYVSAVAEDITDLRERIAKGMPIDSELMPAAQNQILFNFINFKYFMAPTIQVQMQAGMMVQQEELVRSMINGNPYAGTDMKASWENWVSTRLSFLAFHYNPLAWANPDEIGNMLSSRKYSDAAMYGYFFGSMAWNTTKRLGTAVYGKAMTGRAHYESLRSRPVSVESMKIMDAVIGMADEIESTELQALKAANPEVAGVLSGYLKASRTAGKAVNFVPLVKNLAISPIARSTSNYGMQRAYELATNNRLANYVKSIYNKAGGSMIANPAVTPAARVTSQPVVGSGLLTPTSTLEITLSTPSPETIRFTEQESLSIARGEKKLEEVLRAKGYEVREKGAWKAAKAAAKRAAGTRSIVKTDLPRIEQSLAAGQTDIPLSVRYSQVHMSGLDALKIIGEPGKAENIFASLGILETSSAQRQAIVQELRLQMRYQAAFALASKWPGVTGGNIEQLSLVIAMEEDGVGKVFTDDTIRSIQESNSQRGARTGDNIFNGEPEQVRSKLRSLLDNPGDIPEIREKIVRGEAEISTRGSYWINTLSECSQNPSVIRDVRLVDSSLPNGEINLRIKNINILSTISSVCDPSNLRIENLTKMNVMFDAALFRQTLDEVMATGNNESLLMGLAEDQARSQRHFEQLDDMKNKDPMIKYFRSIAEKYGRQKAVAAMMLRELLQQNLPMNYMASLEPNRASSILLSNRMQSVIRRFYTKAKILQSSSKAAVAAAKAVHGTGVPVETGRPAAQQPAFARERKAPQSGEAGAVHGQAAGPEPGTAAETGGRRALPSPDNVDISTGTAPAALEGGKGKQYFGKALSTDALFSIIISGTMSGIEYQKGRIGAGEAVKNTAEGTGIGVAYGVIQRQGFARGLSFMRSFAIAGGVIEGGMALKNEWGRVASLDGWQTARGIGNIAIGAFNGATSGMVLSAGSAGGYTAVLAIPASIAVNYGLVSAEDYIANYQLTENTRSISQRFDDQQIVSILYNVGIKTELTAPARKDAATEAFSRMRLIDELGNLLTRDKGFTEKQLMEDMANKDNNKAAEARAAMQTREFKAHLAAAGIKKIKAGASADINAQLLEQIVASAEKLPEAVRKAGIEVEVSEPMIVSFKEGKIADYKVKFRNADGTDITGSYASGTGFDFQIVIEGDPIAAVDRFSLMQNKDNAILSDLIASRAHFSLSYKEIGQFPKIREQLLAVLEVADRSSNGTMKYSEEAQKDLPAALKRFIANEKQVAGSSSYYDSTRNRFGTTENTINAADIMLMMKKVLTPELYSKKLEKAAPTDKTQVPMMIEALSSIKAQLNYINSVKGSGTILSRQDVFDPDILQIQAGLCALDVLEKENVTGYFDDRTKAALEEIGIKGPIDDRNIDILISDLGFVMMADPREKKGWEKVKQSVPDTAPARQQPEMKAPLKETQKASMLGMFMPGPVLAYRAMKAIWQKSEKPLTINEMMQEQEEKVRQMSPADEFAGTLRSLGVADLTIGEGTKLTKGLKNLIESIVRDNRYGDAEVHAEDVEPGVARVTVKTGGRVIKWIASYGTARVGVNEFATLQLLYSSDGYKTDWKGKEKYSAYLNE